MTGTEANLPGRDLGRTASFYAIYASLAFAMRSGGQTNDLQFAAAIIFPLFVLGLGRLGRPHGKRFSVLKVVLAISILTILFIASALTALSSALMAALWFALQVTLPKARPLQYWEGTLISPGSLLPNASELPNKPEQNPTRF